MKIKLFVVIYFICLFGNSFAKDTYLDSLKNQISIENDDSTLLKLFVDLSWEFCFINTDSAIAYADEAVRLSRNVESLTLKSKAVSQRANSFFYSSEFDKALSDYQKCLMYDELVGDSSGIALSLYSIGNVYAMINKHELALEYFQKSYDLSRKFGDTLFMRDILINMGANYSNSEMYSEALKALMRALEFTQNESEKGEIYQNIGAVHNNIGAYQKANDNLKKAYEIFEKSENKYLLANLCFTISGNYFMLKNYYQSVFYAEKGLKLAEKIGSLELEQRGYSRLADAYYALKDYKKAYDYKELFIIVHDSIFNEKSVQSITEMETKYQTEKKEKENQLLRKQNELDNLEIASAILQISAQKNQSTLLYTGLGLASILIVIIFNRFKISQRQKKEIENQKDEIEIQKQAVEQQNELIEKKNTEITQSINYAQRIQRALLKSEEYLSEEFPSHFILYKPKDIVSGDFYWTQKKGDWIYITVADCTGHGVPGAFMSILGLSFLNEINSSEDQQLRPDEILDKLREKIIKELGQTGEFDGSKDGMDMSLLRLNVKNKEIQWAGAHNPLYIINENDIIEIRADRQPVAFFHYAKPFTCHSKQVETGDRIFLFTDGFIDQFGGEKGKKYKSKRFKTFLKEISDYSIERQKELLNQEFENWRGDKEQIDDVCIIGIEI